MNIIGFLGASVLITLMPGPDIIFVITQSISQGKKAGILTALGLSTGIIVHTTAASLGISLILYESATAFNILKYLGAAYLIFLGIQAILERNKNNFKLGNSPSQEYKKLFKKGILMNILNPKVSLFFLAFLPQFVSANSKNPSLEMMFLGLIFMFQAIIIFSLISILAERLSEKLMKNPKISKTVNWIKASVFLLIGINLALGSK
ncbi:MAG: LysE family translocator [Bacteroidales bacterium]|nr:LysE family translocator [Bacteroidales bacterium]